MKRDGFFKHQVKSFYYAIGGITYNFKTQLHFRFHLLAAAVVIFLGLFYSINPWEWLILIIIVTLVIAAEAFNTAIEETCNLLEPDIHPQARIAKHCAAGGVLILSIGAIIVGLIIFVPKVFNF